MPDNDKLPVEQRNRVRHKVRGTEYQVVGQAEVQTSHAIHEGAMLTIYRGDDGKLWCRPEPEFRDGRFETIRKGKERSELAEQVAHFERDYIQPAASEPVAYRYVHLDYAGRKVSRYGAHAERVNGHDPIEIHPLYAHPPQQPANAGLVEALREVAECMLKGGDDQERDFGWNISRLTKARPMIRKALASLQPKSNGDS